MHPSAADHQGDLSATRLILDVDGEGVPVLLYHPRGLEGPAPMVLIQHPATGSKDEYFVADVARMWARRGWVCGGIDAPFHGERANYDPMGLLRDRARFLAIVAQYARELSATVDAAAAMLPVDIARLGFVGYSLGSMLGVPAVARDGRFRAAAFCLAGEGGLLGRVAGPDDVAPALAGVAVRIVAKTGDELIPRESTEALYAALAGEKDIVWLPGGHFEIGPDVIQAAGDWMKAKL